MPVYNRENLVSRAIDSILNQTYSNFEFIIVDDGSNDKTPLILSLYQRLDPRIKILTNTENKGISYSRQRGLDAAQGKYVAIMDSDDWAVPERLEKSLTFMQDYPEVDAMCGVIAALTSDKFMNEAIQNYVLDKSKKKEYVPYALDGFYEINLTFDNNFQNITSLFKRDFVQKHNIRYDETLTSAEDYDFWAQIAIAGGRLASILNVLGYVRTHTENSFAYYQKMNEASRQIHYKMLSRFFKPDPQDIKLVYSLPEYCKILYKIIESNRQHPQIPQQWLDHHYQITCPEHWDDAILLSHPFWNDFLFPIGDDRYVRYKTQDQATVTKSEDGRKLLVSWDKWPAEEFIYQSNGIYTYYTDGKVSLRVKHPNWSDTISWQVDNMRGCRFSAPAECGTLTFTDDSRLNIDWDNPDYDTEEFYRGVPSLWIFKQSLSQ